MQYDSETYLTGVGFAFLLITGTLMFVLPRRLAVLPVLLLICFMSIGTRIVVLGFNFTMLRTLLMCSVARLFWRHEIVRLTLNRIDRLLIALVISSVVIYTIRWESFAAFKYKLGFAYNAGFFFLCRHLVRDLDEIGSTIRLLALLLLPLSFMMLVEKATGNNIFAVFGGVPAMSQVRDGVVRCQGPFAHPILAGTFGATVLPLLLGLSWQGRQYRTLARLGVGCASLVILCAGSSGPILAAMAGVSAFYGWRFRRYLPHVLWTATGGLVVCALVMKAPVWFLLARINVFSGSTGWHRAHVIDQAVTHLGSWWLLGTKEYATWNPEYLVEWDITNQYVAVGYEGGAITLAIFVAVIVVAFRRIGQSVRAAVDGTERNQRMIWALGAALFSHVVSYFSISYFDQNSVNWYLLLSMISTATAAYVRSHRRVERGRGSFVPPADVVLAEAIQGERTAEPWRHALPPTAV